MISREDLELICNYNEDDSISDSSSLHYIDVIDSSDEELMREIKNREITLDAILDNKEEELSKRVNIEEPSSMIGFGGSSVGIIAPRVFTTSLSSFNKKQFSSYQGIWNSVINFLDSLKNHSSLPPQISNVTITNDPNNSDYDNLQSNARKIITRIMSASGYIATYGRIGPATFVIVGKGSSKYFKVASFVTTPTNPKDPSIIGSIQGMAVIESPLIKPNKVIVGRTENGKDKGGLMVFNNRKDFYMKPVKFSFNKNIVNFEII